MRVGSTRASAHPFPLLFVVRPRNEATIIRIINDSGTSFLRNYLRDEWEREKGKEEELSGRRRRKRTSSREGNRRWRRATARMRNIISFIQRRLRIIIK